MNKIVGFLIFLVLVVAVGSSMVFTVDERQIAVVFAFGEFKSTVNAPVDAPENVQGGGLHFKLPPPFQTVGYIDKRIQTLDDATPREILTSESNMGLVVDWFVKWQVVDAKRFVQTNNGIDMRRAEVTLVSNVQRIFNEEVARRSVQAVLDNDRLEIMEAVLTGIAPVAQDMGVRIVDVRMRRVDYSASTAPKIFEQMITERRSLAAKLRAEGNAEKEKIRAAADYKYRIEVAEAYGNAQKTMGEGDAEVTRLFAEAFGKDINFADFYRSLQAYRESFNTKTDMMVVSPDSEFFKFMQTDNVESKNTP